MSLIRHRIDPRAWPAFARTVLAQRRHLRASWPAAIRTAWLYGPVR